MKANKIAYSGAQKSKSIYFAVSERDTWYLKFVVMTMFCNENIWRLEQWEWHL